MADQPAPPMATYRLQFNADFRLTDAAELVPYFSRLGVTHAYASPLLRARSGSTHGYDVVDPTTINPAVGDKTDMVDLVTELRKFGLGLVVDIVPNHMATGLENPYWRDVLTYGHSSPFASWFDIDWRMPDPELWGRVLVPILGERRSRVIAGGELTVIWSDGRFLVKYYEHEFPVDPATVPTIARFGEDDLRELLPADDSSLTRIEAILTELEAIPKLVARQRKSVDIDRDAIEDVLARFAQVVVGSPRLGEWADRTAGRFSTGEGSGERLREFLDNQPYRLVHWRDAARAINYRRFFDINELISIRQEDPHVFTETHQAILRWVEDRHVVGLRIDHIDGLRDPAGYLQRLHAAIDDAAAGHEVPVFVEKILAPDEELPEPWPTAGTTGYEFLNEIEAVLVSRAGFARIEDHYQRMLGRPVDFKRIAAWGKRRILRNDLSPHIGRLADTLLRLAEKSASLVTAGGETAGPVDPPTDVAEGGGPAEALARQHGLTRRDLIDAIVEVIVALPVYRTYITTTRTEPSGADRRHIHQALVGARLSGRAAPGAIDFLGSVLTLTTGEGVSEHDIHERAIFVERFQQLTGPAAAKGIEDTALYAYAPLASLNEVGGEPHLPEGDVVERFHAAAGRRAERWPRAMLCTTTHDTKRTADVRARLDVLSEMPNLWNGLVKRWRRQNRPIAVRVGGKRAPGAAAEYLFYQTVLGIWPVAEGTDEGDLPSEEAIADVRERVSAYMLKAIREAKTRTSWTQPNEQYEQAVDGFVRTLLDPGQETGRTFQTDMQRLARRIAVPGYVNALARTLVQMTAPGAPDLYQGDELFNFALVDPDNRRPVDYEQRGNLLEQVVTGTETTGEDREAFLADLLAGPEDGRIKLLTIHTALTARRTFPAIFAGGEYRPLTAEGERGGHVLAYAKVTDEAGAAMIVVPRWVTALTEGAEALPLGEPAWGATALTVPDDLADRTWRCLFTGVTHSANEGRLPLAAVLSRFPVALLVDR